MCIYIWKYEYGAVQYFLTVYHILQTGFHKNLWEKHGVGELAS